MSLSSSESRRRLLVISDAVVPSGFARVVRSILEPMLARYQVEQLGVNYFGDPHDWPWPVYPAMIGGDQFGAQRIPYLLGKVKPELIFIVSNLSRINSYCHALGEQGKDIPVVAYCAVEAGPIDPRVLAYLQQLNRLVFYTNYIADAFHAVEPQQAEESDWSAPPCGVLPHGVDTEVFFPLEPDVADREAVKRRAKEKLFRGDEEHTNSFVVLNANRNEPRKRIDSTLQGFAEFARDKGPEVKLHLHMGTTDMGWDVVALAKHYGIYERLIVTSRAQDTPNVDLEQLNLIYNAADIGMNTSSSEGWGLVAFEHAATRTAQLMVRQGTLEELWGGRAELIDPAATLFDPHLRCEQAIVSADAIAASLNKLYDQPYRQTVADRCYAHATQPHFRWQQISARWEELFDDVLT